MSMFLSTVSLITIVTIAVVIYSVNKDDSINV